MSLIGEAEAARTGRLTEALELSDRAGGSPSWFRWGRPTTPSFASSR